MSEVVEWLVATLGKERWFGGVGIIVIFLRFLLLLLIHLLTMRSLDPLLMSFLPRLFLLLIYHEVVVDARQRLIVREDLEHLLADLRVDFLAVPALAHRLVLVQRVLDVNKLRIRNVFNVQPVDGNGAGPLALLLPECVVLLVRLDAIHHLGNSTEVL